MTHTATIRLSQFIGLPPEDVWRALVTPELLAEWWTTGDIKAEVGHRFTLDMGQFGDQPCEVVAVEENRLLAYTFAADTTITWRLKAAETGTRLELEHVGFDLSSPSGRTAYDGMSGGWPHILALIESTLAS
jgi:uncharacterized protein YndB with AHSA1/START domain